ncbi:carbonyl reductase [NADPH] 1-like [Colias croceus]|uniref:carbonyl reductase [NADPH] 1-like n=1 Tax=Colias crocea TaxID=72248 RepID=UPI001E27E0AA|nr:carbonyl reductase [NADPH] 1-like [Colias croceus]
MSKVAVVTGSNRGIGFAIVKGLCKRFDGIVYLTSRDENRGRKAVEELNKLGLKPHYHQLDVSDRNSIIKFRDHIKEKHGHLDILVNNAAIVDSLTEIDHIEVLKKVIDINYRSVLTMQELIYPLVRDNGRILNISADCGHLSNIRNKYWIERLSNKNLSVQDVNEFVDWFLQSVQNGTLKTEDIADNATVPGYRVAKVALCAVTVVQQRELASRRISVNSMHPGLVRTEMTNGIGFLSTDESAETPLYILLDAPDSLQGAFIWYDKRVIDWYDYNADYYFKMSTLTE